MIHFVLRHLYVGGHFKYKMDSKWPLSGGIFSVFLYTEEYNNKMYTLFLVLLIYIYYMSDNNIVKNIKL